MRSTAPGLLPILRSRYLAEMLTLLLLHPDAEYTLSEVAGKLGLPLTTVQREATRLSGSGLIRERHVGRSRLVSANPASRYTRPLTELVSLASGPQFVIGEEFNALSAIAVAIYGSWAARHEGITGPAPNDVDVLVIGDVPRRDMDEAAERAEQRLGFPVNPVLCSLQRWLAAADPLIQQVRSAPLVWVIGEEPQEGGGREGCAEAPERPRLSVCAGGHYVIEEVIRAQFGPSPRAFGGLRRRRNELEYPLYPTEQASPTEAAETLKTAAEIIDAAAKLFPNLGFF